MSKTKAQLEAENDALRALVAAIGELLIPPAAEDQRLAARIIRSICEEVDKYPPLLGQLAKDLRERATSVIEYLPPACPADHPSGAWGCTLPAGHDGPHKSVTPDGHVRKEWDDEDPAIAEDAVAIIAQSIRTGQPVIVEDDDPEPLMMLVLGDADIDPVTAMLAAGHTLAFDHEAVPGRCFARLTAPDGTLAEGGYGDTREQALRILRERLARQESRA